MQSERPIKEGTPVRVARAAAAAIAVLGCAALVSACGSSKNSESSGAKGTVNTARVATSIEQTILEKRHLHSTVVCPAAMPAETGKTFECIASVTAAKAPHTVTKTPFVVTIRSNRGYVTYEGK